MFLRCQHIFQADPHHGATAQFRLSQVGAAGCVDPLDNFGIKPINIIQGWDIALRCPLASVNRPYLQT